MHRVPLLGGRLRIGLAAVGLLLRRLGDGLLHLAAVLEVDEEQAPPQGARDVRRELGERLGRPCLLPSPDGAALGTERDSRDCA